MHKAKFAIIKKEVPGLSTGYVHAAVAATARVIGKKNIGSEIDIGGLGCGGAVRDRIAPAIDDFAEPSRGKRDLFILAPADF